MTKRNDFCDCNVLHEDAVKQVSQQMLPDAAFMEFAAFFKTFADPTRCKIIFALQKQELCVCDLANILSMTKSSVSHQLAGMRESGVVKCRRAGKEVFYTLDDDHVESIFSATQLHVAHKKTEHLE